MRRRSKHDDDDDILGDGERLRVPMTMMDADAFDPVQRAVARDSLTVVDGQGGEIGLCRPGFRIPAADARHSRTVKRDPKGRIISQSETEEEEDDARDAAMCDARQVAYDAYEQELTRAWRGKATTDAAAEGACSDCDESGLDFYETYDSELREAWRCR